MRDYTITIRITNDVLLIVRDLVSCHIGEHYKRERKKKQEQASILEIVIPISFMRLLFIIL